MRQMIVAAGMVSIEESSSLFRLKELNKLDLSFNSSSGTIPHSLFGFPTTSFVEYLQPY